jgi:ankyrin repeat protein
MKRIVLKPELGIKTLVSYSFSLVHSKAVSMIYCFTNRTFFLAGLSDLGYACELNDVVWVRKLLNSGAKVNVADYRLSYPIHFAARHGNVEITTSLIEQGELCYIM